MHRPPPAQLADGDLDLAVRRAVNETDSLEFGACPPERVREGSARHPAYSALASERGAVMPDLDDALDRYFSEIILPTPSLTAL